MNSKKKKQLLDKIIESNLLKTLSWNLKLFTRTTTTTTSSDFYYHLNSSIIKYDYAYTFLTNYIQIYPEDYYHEFYLNDFPGTNLELNIEPTEKLLTFSFVEIKDLKSFKNIVDKFNLNINISEVESQFLNKINLNNAENKFLEEKLKEIQYLKKVNY